MVRTPRVFGSLNMQYAEEEAATTARIGMCIAMYLT